MGASQLTRRAFKIAPGEQGRYWDECLAGGWICMGWDDVGDLGEFTSKEDFRQAFRDAYPYNGNEAQVSRKANELWTLTELQPAPGHRRPRHDRGARDRHGD